MHLYTKKNPLTICQKMCNMTEKYCSCMLMFNLELWQIMWDYTWESLNSQSNNKMSHNHSFWLLLSVYVAAAATIHLVVFLTHHSEAVGTKAFTYFRESFVVHLNGYRWRNWSDSATTLAAFPCQYKYSQCYYFIKDLQTCREVIESSPLGVIEVTYKCMVMTLQQVLIISHKIFIIPGYKFFFVIYRMVLWNAKMLVVIVQYPHPKSVVLIVSHQVCTAICHVLITPSSLNRTSCMILTEELNFCTYITWTMIIISTVKWDGWLYSHPHIFDISIVQLGCSLWPK